MQYRVPQGPGKFHVVVLVLKKNTCGNPSTEGFLGLLNQVLAFVTFFSQVGRKILWGSVVVSQKPFKT